MPKIDTYTAQTVPAVPHQPLQFLETGEASLAPIAAQTTKLGTQWSTIAGNLKAQSDDLAAKQANADYEAGIATINLELSRDPEILADPLRYPEEYAKRSNELQKHILGNMKSPEAQGMFQTYSQQQFPGEFVKARATGLRMMDAKLTGEFIVAKDRLSSEAGEAATPEIFAQKVKEFEQLALDSVDRHVLTAAQKETALVTFKQDVAEKNMRFIGDQDPDKMRALQQAGIWKALSQSKRIEIMEHVSTQQEVGDRRAREKFARVQKVELDGLEALANFGKLSRARIANGQKNLDPVIPDPATWNRLAELNDKAPGLDANDAGGLRAVDAIRASASLVQEPTKAAAQDALAELELLRAQGGLSTRAMSHLIATAEHIQNRIAAIDREDLAATKYTTSQDQRKESEDRAKTNFQRTQEDRKIHDALVEFDSRTKRPSIDPQIDKMRETKRLMRRRQLEDYMRKNPSFDRKETLDMYIPEAEKNRQPDNIDRLLTPRSR